MKRKRPRSPPPPRRPPPTRETRRQHIHVNHHENGGATSIDRGMKTPSNSNIDSIIKKTTHPIHRPSPASKQSNDVCEASWQRWCQLNRDSGQDPLQRHPGPRQLVQVPPQIPPHFAIVPLD